AGVPPHANLSAVLAERRRRDAARLAHQASVRAGGVQAGGMQAGGVQAGGPVPPPWTDARPGPVAPPWSGAPAAPPAGDRPAYGRPGPPSPGSWEARPPVAPAEPPRPTPGGFAPPQ
ncbi:RDD family protein, partial [Nonomuraea sp. NPDC005501]